MAAKGGLQLEDLRQPACFNPSLSLMPTGDCMKTAESWPEALMDHLRQQ